MVVHVEKTEFIKGHDGNRQKKEIIIMNKSYVILLLFIRHLKKKNRNYIPED